MGIFFIHPKWEFSSGKVRSLSPRKISCNSSAIQLNETPALLEFLQNIVTHDNFFFPAAIVAKTFAHQQHTGSQFVIPSEELDTCPLPLDKLSQRRELELAALSDQRTLGIQACSISDQTPHCTATLPPSSTQHIVSGLAKTILQGTVRWGRRQGRQKKKR